MGDIIFKSPKATAASQNVSSQSVLFQEQPNEVCMLGALLPALINFGWCLISASDCLCILFHFTKASVRDVCCFPPIQHSSAFFRRDCIHFQVGPTSYLWSVVYLGRIFLSLFHPALRCGHGSNHSTSYLKPLKWLVQRYTSADPSR